MITQVDVKGFKGFKHLQLPQLRRTTLIGGKNNIGKTSLLEAIFLFFDRMNPQMVTNQFARRNVGVLPLAPDTLWAPIFFDYQMEDNITISIACDKIRETMEIAFNQAFAPSVVPIKKTGPGGQRQISTDEKPTPVYALDISYKTNGKKTCRIFSLELMVWACR